MSAVAYTRVSSRAQDLSTQKASIERAAAARGDVIATWYQEKKSAKTTDRAELQRLRADARAGHFRRLFVFRVDRLARSGIRDTFEIVEELRRHGVEIVTIADGFSLDGPAADVVLAVMAWGAQMERLATAERIAAARERLAEEGRPWGRPRRMSDELVARVRAMHAEGRSIRDIAVAIKHPKSTIGRALAPVSQNGAPDPGPGAT